jgi:hypothetical protein
VLADALASLLCVFGVLRPAFTQPSYANALVVFAGWVLTNGSHAVTAALVATDVARRRHHEAFHRFFSRGTWDPDEVGRLLFLRFRKLVPAGAPIPAVLDDTLAAKKGPKVFGIGSHLDAVRSTKAFRVFSFGHVWVTLAVVVRLPFHSRQWALPVLFRLYRNEKECKAKGHRHKRKTELARELVDVFASWVGIDPIDLAADSAYSNDTVMGGLPPSINVLGAMRPDAVLTAAAVQKKRSGPGRPRVRGKLLPKPTAIAENDTIPWRSCRATLYDSTRTIRYKTLVAQWYRACGVRLLRIVIVRIDHGAIPFRVFFCTDPNRTVVEILEGYARRWAIEVCFRDLKQLLGFGDSSARKKAAVERTAPFVGLVYTVLVLWFAEGAHKSSLATPPIRPWYRHKRGLSFTDVLRAAQRALVHLDVLDPARSVADLRAISSPTKGPAEPRLKRAS